LPAARQWRADRAYAQAVVAAQQDGQAALAQFLVDGIVHRTVPCRDFVQVAVAVRRRQPGIGGAVEVAAVGHLEALGLDDRAQVRHAQGFWPHGRAARAGADVGGRADQGDVVGQVGGVLQVADSGRVHQVADSTALN
jgi:hypothetical protein